MIRRIAGIVVMGIGAMMSTDLHSPYPFIWSLIAGLVIIHGGTDA